MEDSSVVDVQTLRQKFDQQELLAEVAHLYYEVGSDQTYIAHQLNISRSTVSRLLQRARTEGIVEISIHYPLATSPELAKELQNRFQLKQALILRTTRLNADSILSRVSLLAAKFLETNLKDGDILAISWGSTLYHVTQNFSPTRRSDVKIVQLIGTLDSYNSEIDGATLVRRFAHALEAQYFSLNAPLIVESVQTQRALMQEPTIRQVLDLASNADLALVGIGTIAHPASAAVRAILLSDTNLKALQLQNAVGDVCSQYFDQSGRLVANDVNSRVVALDVKALQRIPLVIGVAVGTHKASAILGALRGCFINALITDDRTAEQVIELDNEFPVAH